MEYIRCVADILEPDLSMQEVSIAIDELPDPSFEENMDEDDFQTLVEEIQKSEIPLTDLTGFNGWNQLTPPLSSPCPTTSNLPTSNVSQSPVPSTAFLVSCDAPSTSTDRKENELAIQEDEVISQKEFENETLSLTTQEDEDVHLGYENVISAEFAKCAISTVSVPPLEQATKKSDLKESKEMSSFSALGEQRFSEKASPKVPTTPKVDIAKIRSAAFGGPVEDIVFYKDEYKEEYGKFFKISICNFI